MNNETLLKLFLSYFWKPAFRIISDVKKSDLKPSVVQLDIPTLIQKTEDEKYWAFFTPNGNFWKDKKVWQKIAIKKEYWEWWNALRIDLDFNDKLETDVEKQKEYIQRKCVDFKIKPNFLVQTWRWWHLYFLLHQEINDYFKNSEIEKIIAFLGEEIFKEYWDPSNVHIAKLMRLPFTYHNKKGKKLVKLFVFDNSFNFIQAEDPKHIIEAGKKVLQKKHILHVLKFVNDERKKKQVILKADKELGDTKRLLLKDIFPKLPKYIRYYEWLWEHHFVLSSDNTISIVNNNTQDVYIPDWYKFNERENYVHNFSQQYHPIEERPRGWPIPFLYYYFNRDWEKVRQFLQEEFWYDYWLTDDDTDWTWIPLDEEWHKFLLINKKWVFSVRTIKDKITKTLVLDWKVELLSVNYKHREPRLWIKYLQPVKVYIVKYNNKLQVIQPVENRLKFNKFYSNIWLRWLWTDNELLALFNYWDKQTEAENKYEYIEYSGIYNYKLSTWETKYYIVAKDKILYWQPRKKYIIDTISSTRLIQKNKKTTIRQALDLYKQVRWYNWVIAFLAMCVGFGMNLLEPVRKMKAYVGTSLWIFWDSGTGKSTMVFTFYSLMGLYYKDNMLTAMSTKQPIKTEWSDYMPLIIEEFTGEMNPDIEDLFRNVLSNNKDKKWTPDSNMEFDYVTSLFITWEDLPSATSVKNRLALVYMLRDKNSITQKSKQAVTELQELNIVDDYVKTVIRLLEDIDKIELFVNTELKSIFQYDERIRDTYALLLYLWKNILNKNELQKLIKAIEKNLYLSGLIKDNKKEEESSTVFADLMSILYIWHVSRSLMVNIFIQEDQANYSIMFSWKAFQKKMGLIKSVCDKLNLKLDTSDLWVFTINFSIPENNRTKEQQALAMFMDTVKWKFKNVVSVIYY